MAGKSRTTNPSTPSPAPADQEPKGFLWDGLALLDQGNSSFTIEPHVCGGVPLAESSAKSTPVTVISDFLGTTIGLVEGENFTPTPLTAFGDQASNSTGASYPTAARLARFTGKHFDADLKAYNFLFRNYRPDFARWAMIDPIGFPDGINHWVFVNASPLNSIDRLGLTITVTPKNAKTEKLNFKNFTGLLTATPTVQGANGAIAIKIEDTDDESGSSTTLTANVTGNNQNQIIGTGVSFSGQVGKLNVVSTKFNFEGQGTSKLEVIFEGIFQDFLDPFKLLKASFSFSFKE